MKNFITSCLVVTLLFVAIFLFISFAWIGAEHIIEHSVNYGTVDRAIACVISVEIINKIAAAEKRYLARVKAAQDIVVKEAKRYAE